MIAAWVAGLLLMVGASGAIYRIVKGPSLLDRAIGSDVLLVVLSGALILDMAVHRHTHTIVLVVLASMVGFVGSVTIARFVEDNRPDLNPEDPDASQPAKDAGVQTAEGGRTS
jgi:multicomponent Na+:H+ antiporter subunit F